MSSSWIHRENLLGSDIAFSALPLDLQSQFHSLEEAVGRFILSASLYGTVVLITNAESGWVEYSAKRFMPRLIPLLKSIRIVSARSTYERYYPGAPLCWKAAAFAHEANQIFDGMKERRVREIISFGDSNEERTAVKIAAGQLGAIAKSVKFIDLPTPEHLCKEIHTVTNLLEAVCSCGNELDLMLSDSIETTVEAAVSHPTSEVGCRPTLISPTNTVTAVQS